MSEVRGSESGSRVIGALRRQLFGPAGAEDEVVAGKPYWRYLCGILFPYNVNTSTLNETEEPDADGEAGETGLEDPSVAMAYETLPSSMGISFYATGATAMEVAVGAARYEPIPERNQRWQRVALSREGQGVVSVPFPAVGESGNAKRTLFSKRAKIHVVFRPRTAGHLVTVSLVNEQDATSRNMAAQIEAMLFQCRFEVTLNSGAIGEYPKVERLAHHQEDEELALIYRKRSTYGIGHGCAAVWEFEGDGRSLNRICAEALPETEVKALTNQINLSSVARPCLSLQWLASKSTDAAALEKTLMAFLKEYSDWIKGQSDVAANLDAEHKVPAERLIKRQERALERMRRGVRVIASEEFPHVLEAFRIAQRAMLLQFAWSARCGDSSKDLGEGVTATVDLWSDEFKLDPSWRPFQLAFQLLVIESLVDPSCEDRDVLDLLWFPTGGGKTEAYLAIVAFEIAHRRLRYGEAGCGTVAMMRYTLRLLTTQQFERSAKLVSSLEVIRRTDDSVDLGASPITLGLWVGAQTPNSLDSDSERTPGAVQLYRRLLDDKRPENPFQLLACPCCGTRIVPKEQSPSDSQYGIRVTASSFSMFCPDNTCLLHKSIPVSVVDEDLYQRPPTVLIGTIDKFARMVWVPDSRTFLGKPEDRGVLPPSLIIQDELHLVTGPLGTIAGVYEAAIDTTITRSGSQPKYIAATATIQRAEDQVRSLYARRSFLFPPPGLSVEDSFFSREDDQVSGRQYLGAMGNGMYSGLTSLIQVSAAAAASVMEVPNDAMLADGDTKTRDSYWTQVIYHNSKQELGKTTTMLRDDVLSRLAILQPDEDQRRPFDRIEELSANLKGSQVPDALQRLQTSWPDQDAIDALACTNMISVGVDVSRLGLMIVKGQPKSTAEYIQASSRVGRDARRPPGIVVALYSANRPRDRSHYENFQSYHQSLYRHVEPVTVTPFAPPARERTLHAALVLSLRHCLGWVRQHDADLFDEDDPTIKSVVQALGERFRAACKSDEVSDVEKHLDSLVERWAQERDAPGNSLTFNGGRQFKELLEHFEPGAHSRRAIWRTLNSMRHVDGETAFEVRGQFDRAR